MLRNPVFWIVIVFLILLLFGGRRLPDLASSIGQSLKIFKKEMNELQEEDNGTPASATTTNDAANIPSQASAPTPPATGATDKPTP